MKCIHSLYDLWEHPLGLSFGILCKAFKFQIILGPVAQFIHIYIIYGMDPAQLMHAVVKQASKQYFRFTWSQT